MISVRREIKHLRGQRIMEGAILVEIVSEEVTSYIIKG